MPHTIVSAVPEDAAAIAALHIESWRSAYRNLIPDTFLAAPVVEDRLRLWTARMAADDEGPRSVMKAMHGPLMVGFACVVRDADPAWGPLLDNLHVKPAFKGLGIGRDLFLAARGWAAAVATGRPMHLWVIEDNAGARRFYDRQGGVVVERQIVEVTDGISTPALRYVWDPRE
jgi:hypothetical protein